VNILTKRMKHCFLKHTQFYINILTYEIHKKMNIHNLVLHKIENIIVKSVSSQINNIQLAYILVF
jgi:ribulose bisphosphate carboxylase small subunit